MQIPMATYRIQFGPRFGFREAQAIVPYLHDLGISHLYASPIFKARQGSPHGYDGVDPNQLNPELGTAASFEALIQSLQNRRMGWLQDIVPNHMAYDGANPWITDLFENGPASRYYRFFDIDWDHDHPELNGKVLAPFLGHPLDQCLENREIRLTYGPDGFSLVYYDLAFPLKAESYALVLARLRASLGVHPGKRLKSADRLHAIVSDLEKLPALSKPEARRGPIQTAKADLWRLHQQSARIRQAMAATLKSINEANADTRVGPLRKALESGQIYSLAFWKTAGRRINYRRFFAINELIALRQDSAVVFNQTHALILDLIRRGCFTGLRLDHIDGLADPAGYLQRLRKKVKTTYLVVEKILAPGEQLCPDWPVQGTTGYDFGDRLNGLFCQRAHAEHFDRLHHRWCQAAPDFEALAFESKQQFLQQEMSGDLDNLARRLQQAAQEMLPNQNLARDRLRSAVTLVLSAFPVYRSYIGPQGPGRQSRRWARQAVEAARTHSPSLKREIDFIRALLNHAPITADRTASRSHRQQAIARFQQLCAPAAAKGVEDTALYRYHRLISLNEVGGHPGRFGCPLAQFHTFLLRRRKQWPHSMNSTSTHDSKRSEDVRARINVLSEMPDQWQRQVTAWQRLNRECTINLNGRRVPDASMAYFIYQTLVGACPLDTDRLSAFAQRMSAYVVKAAREAKRDTAWIAPDGAYETALAAFVNRILAPTPQNHFLKKFFPFLHQIAHFGLFNALSQTLIKITAPGIPDLYQGLELPTFSLVDPDNRRPVDFAIRKRWLAQIRTQHKADPITLINNLLAEKERGRIKLFLTFVALQTRRRYGNLYQQGRYVPLTAAGRFSDHVVAFARQHAKAWSLTLVPRFISGLVRSGTDPLGRGVWGDTVCRLPAKAPACWTDAFTARRIDTAGSIGIGDALHYFPAALLIGGVTP